MYSSLQMSIIIFLGLQVTNEKFLEMEDSLIIGSPLPLVISTEPMSVSSCSNKQSESQCSTSFDSLEGSLDSAVGSSEWPPHPQQGANEESEWPPHPQQGESEEQEWQDQTQQATNVEGGGCEGGPLWPEGGAWLGSEPHVASLSPSSGRVQGSTYSRSPPSPNHDMEPTR